MSDPEDALDILTAIVSNLVFFIGYTLALLLMVICKIAEMAMVCGYLLARVFLLEVMKFLFPIAVALSTIKQTSGLIAKWLRMYIGLSLLGIVYIGIIHFCALTQEHLQNAFTDYSGDGFFSNFLTMNMSVWGSLITIVVVFTLKVNLFSKATSFITSFFN